MPRSLGHVRRINDWIGSSTAPDRSGVSAAPVPAVVGLLACALAFATPNDGLVGLWDASTRTPSFYIGIVFSASGVLILRRLGPTLIRSPALGWFIAAFGIAMTVLAAELVSGNVQYSEAFDATKPFKVLWMAVIVTAVARVPRWRGALLASYIAGWWLFIAISLAQLALGRETVMQHFQVDRVSIMGMNANAQSVVAGTGLLILVARAANSSRWWDVAGLAVGVASGGFLFILGNSRTALVALLAGLLTIVIVQVRARDGSQRPGKHRIRLAVAAAAALSTAWLGVSHISAAAAAVDGVRARVEAALDGSDRGSRDVLAERTLAIAAANPLGVGYGVTLDLLGDDPHNDFLKLAAEGGFVAAACLIAALFTLARIGWRLSTKREAAAPVACLALTAATAMAGQGLVRTSFWLFFSLVTAMDIANRGEGRKGV